MKLIKFKDGTYSIRRLNIWVLGYEYRSFSPTYEKWYMMSSDFFRCCRVDKETAEKEFNLLTDKGEPV